MKTHFFNSCSDTYNQNLQYRDSNKSLNFEMPRLTKDVFCSSGKISFGARIAFFSHTDGITQEAIRKLPKAELDSLLQIARKNVGRSLAKKVLKYTQILKKGLDNKFGENNYVFVSIGQSPAVFAEILPLLGVKTATCPISELSFVKDLKSVLENPKIGKYFEYLRKICLDPQKIKRSSKQHVFVDYCCTGNSLKKFEELLRNSGYDFPNVKFDRLVSIPTSYYNWNRKEEVFLDSFANRYIGQMKLKEKYSPIFRLPVSQIHRVQEYKDKTPVNERFNMLKFLIINELNI